MNGNGEKKRDLFVAQNNASEICKLSEIEFNLKILNNSDKLNN